MLKYPQFLMLIIFFSPSGRWVSNFSWAEKVILWFCLSRSPKWNNYSLNSLYFMNTTWLSALFQEGRISTLYMLITQGHMKVSRDTFTFTYNLEINRALFLYQICIPTVLWTSAHQQEWERQLLWEPCFYCMRVK